MMRNRKTTNLNHGINLQSSHIKYLSQIFLAPVASSPKFQLALRLNVPRYNSTIIIQVIIALASAIRTQQH